MSIPGDLDDPALCGCGHYLYIHTRDGCPGWGRCLRLNLLIGMLTITLPCRCKVQHGSQAKTTTRSGR